MLLYWYIVFTSVPQRRRQMSTTLECTLANPCGYPVRCYTSGTPNMSDEYSTSQAQFTSSPRQVQYTHLMSMLCLRPNLQALMVTYPTLPTRYTPNTPVLHSFTIGLTHVRLPISCAHETRTILLQHHQFTCFDCFSSWVLF